MNSKTFRAENMLEALEQVRKDLGPEAVILSVRKVLDGPAWQVWKKPLVEVVAIASENENKSKKAKIKTKSEPKNEPVYLNPLAQYQKFSKIEEEIDSPQPSVKKESGPVKTEMASNEILANAIKEALELSQKSGKKTAEKQPSGSQFRIRKDTYQEQDETIFSHKIDRFLEGDENALDLGEDQRVEVEEENFDKKPYYLKKIYSELKRKGLDTDLLNKIIEVSEKSLSPRALMDYESVLENIKFQLNTRIKSRQLPNTSPNVIYLVGSSGSGKTSVCAKLAILFANDKGKKVCWVSSDTVRIGAIAETKTYTETIGIDLKLVYTAKELKMAVLEALDEGAEVVLVDTPAFNPFREEDIIQIGSLFSAVQQKLIWLVVAADRSAENMVSTLGAISPFNPDGLVLTKLDATNNFASLVNISLKSKLPLAYFSFGSGVINDLAAAESEKLIDALFAERFYE